MLCSESGSYFSPLLYFVVFRLLLQIVDIPKIYIVATTISWLSMSHLPVMPLEKKRATTTIFSFILLHLVSHESILNLVLLSLSMEIIVISIISHNSDKVCCHCNISAVY